jgi:phospholipase/carboxylesterase/glyoxalase family protein
MNMTIDSHQGLHQGQPILMAGQPLDRAAAVMILVHGRGASAKDILTLVPDLEQPDFAYLAPQAADNAWYPNRFLAPIDSNEPWLSSALTVLTNVLDRVTEVRIPIERTLLLGFSQGACLTLEFVARQARRYGGVIGLSGGLIGPEDTPRNYAGSLDGTPIFLGCSDVDPYIPRERVQHTAEVLTELGGDVTVQLYPNMAHTISQAEIDFTRNLMSDVLHRP